MTRFVISDLHLAHANIIEYCDREFASVEEMNAALCARWNQVVGPEDTVVMVGDLVMGPHELAMEFVDRLNGSLVLIEGNHDDVDPDRASFPVVNACEISVGKYNFYCVHRPENAPADAEWVLYGHHHNNDVQQFPFIDPVRNRVNVSVELLREPLPVSRLAELLDRGERMERRPLAE